LVYFSQKDSHFSSFHWLMSRKRLTAQDASLVWQYCECAEAIAARALTETRGYNLSTYYRIIRNEGRISGLYLHSHHEAKWTAQQRAQAAQIIAMNPAVTLRDIIDEAVQQGLPLISVATLHVDPKILLITRKLMTTTTQMRNTPQTKQHRQLYSQWVLADQNLTFIYVDEFGFQIGTQRHFGRAPRGLPAQHITSLMRSANVSVCLAASPAHGLIYFDFNYGAFDRGTFSGFIDSLAAEIAAQQIPNPCFILDNCAIHNLDDVTEVCEMFGSEFNFLSIYFPMPNVVEGCISDVKRTIQSAVATVLRPALLSLANAQYGQRIKQRAQLLL
jgi:hypothetical protein